MSSVALRCFSTASINGRCALRIEGISQNNERWVNRTNKAPAFARKVGGLGGRAPMACTHDLRPDVLAHSRATADVRCDGTVLLA
jgi:hypothetical protein